MRILYSPIVGIKHIDYTFNGEVIKATIDGASDTFDFSSFPDGVAEQEQVETTLPLNPIQFAKRENGVLSVSLTKAITSDASEEEQYPDWIEV